MGSRTKDGLILRYSEGEAAVETVERRRRREEQM